MVTALIYVFYADFLVDFHKAIKYAIMWSIFSRKRPAVSSLFSQQQAIEQSLNWQALQPDLVIQDFPLEPVDFWALQPNATQGYRFIFTSSDTFLTNDESGRTC